MKFKNITQENFQFVLEIYEEGIATEKATFETETPSFEKWDNSHLSFGRMALFENNRMIGWGALSKVSDRCVYEGVAENSLYVSASHHGLRVGTKILKKTN